MLVTVYQITCHYISEDGVLYSYHCENLKSHVSLLLKKGNTLLEWQLLCYGKILMRGDCKICEISHFEEKQKNL